ncbi:MAG: hypothetical protein ABJC09_03965 [Terriglobia bacterium]
MRCSVCIFLLVLPTLHAAQYSGTVRAADQFVPGAAVTARKGPDKVSAFTDENGRFSMELAPGVWDIDVAMFEFTPAHSRVTAGTEAIRKDWTLEMPRVGERAGSAGPPQTATAGPVARSSRPQFQNRAGAGRTGPGRSGPGAGGPRQGSFQSASVRAAGQAPNSEPTPPSELAEAAPVDAGDDESFLVNGSVSGGLAAASDDESRRQRAAGGGRGSPGGAGATGAGLNDGSAPGVNGLGIPPGMSGLTSNDSLGLGGFGASAINGGFNVGASGDGGFGGGSTGGRGGAGGGGGGGRGGRGGAGGGRAGGRGGRQRSGPYNGQFASFGNKRRSQPAYTGSVSLTAQNSVLNAAPFSLNGQTSQKPYSSHSSFTGTFGGPMVIPKLLNWQRANFNITYQGSINRNGENLIGSVPTAAERAGDFSAAKTNSAVSIFDPLTGTLFPGNVIPASRINPAATGLLNFFPLPTYPGLVQNYRLITTVPNSTQSIGVRLNAPLTNKDRLNFNIQFQGRDSKSRTLFGYLDSTNGAGLSAAAGWSHSFAPRFNNSANLTFSRNNSKNAPFFAYSTNVAAQLGITGTSQDPINFGPPSLSFTNFSSLSDATASVGRNQTMNFTDNITYVVRRKHNFTFGFLYRRLQQNSLNYQNSRGSFSFSGLLTSALEPDGQPVQGTGFDFADFLLGFPQSSSLRFGGANNYFRSWSASGFGQDDWRVTAGLTLNLGLRYEYFAPYTELQGHLANLVPNSTFTAVSVVTPGTAGYPTSLVRPDNRAISPRIGVAYRPWAKKPLLFRTGYSIFFSGSPYGQIATQLASQPPFAKTASISTNLNDPLTLQNGFAVAPSQTITNTYAIDPDYRLSYAQTWNFTLQNTLPHGLVVETEYIGTKGTALAINEQPNRALPGSSVSNPVLQIPNASGFTYLRSGANSTFNAGQLRVTRRFTRGISATALYTFAKAIDNASSFNGTGGTLVQYLNDLRLERGPSSFDQRHRLQTTFLFSSPVGVHGMMRNGGWKTTALAGWSLSGTFSATSGTPLTAYVSGNLANTGGLAAFGNSRAQATGISVEALDGGYFNPAAFTIPAAGQFGDAGRNTIPGLFQLSLNSSLNRAFRFGDSRRQLQVRINATNVMNHVTITSIGTTVNSATFGLPTGASATRNVSLMLRYNF